jgi:hypothetical protein
VTPSLPQLAQSETELCFGWDGRCSVQSNQG